MVKDYLNQINGRLTDDVNLFTGGLNTYSDRAFIQPFEMPYVMNMTMYKPPMMCTRASRDHQFMSADGNIISAMWADSDNLIVYITQDTSTGAQKLWIRYMDYFNTGTWQTIEKSNIELDNVVNYYFSYCRTETSEYLYFGNDISKYKIDISQRFEIGESTNELFPTEKIDDDYYGIPCWHKGRMFFARDNMVFFSALNDFDNFTTFPDMSLPAMMYSDVTLTDGVTPTSPDVPASTGAYNTGAYKITLNGSNIATENTTFYYDANEMSITFQTGNKLTYNDGVWQTSLPDYSSYAGYFSVTSGVGSIKMIKSFDDKLVIFCEHSIHLLYGDTPLTTSSYQFQLVDLNKNLGCISPKSVAVTSSRLIWLGDDREIYAYSGSYIEILSQPYEDKRTSGLDSSQIQEIALSIATATSNKYYIQLKVEGIGYALLVYDMLKGIWWAEDTGRSSRLYSITNYSNDFNSVIMSDGYGEVLKTTKRYDGYDVRYDPVDESAVRKPIKYRFHTRVYGADGVNSRKTITKVYLQASANATVYLSDAWTSIDNWSGKISYDSLKEIGKLEQKGQKLSREGYLLTYDSNDYEQQLCVVPKMYGERLNTFQIIVEGEGPSKFYLMKREWSAR